MADITLAEARKTMDAEVERLVAFFPPEILAEEYTGPIGPWSSMWCDPRTTGPIDKSLGIKLPGGASLLIRDDVDLEPVIERIAENYEAEAGWEVTRERDRNGLLEVYLRSSDGFQYTVSYFSPRFTPDVWDVEVYAFSPCMPVPDGHRLIDKY